MERLAKSGRVIMAVVVGALIGGVGIGLWVLYLMLIPSFLGIPNGGADPGTLFGSVLAGGLIGALAFLTGILMVGAPVWLVMHGLGLNQPWAAALAGGLVTVGGAVVLGALLGAPLSPTELGLLGLNGLVVGWVIQRIAYTRPRPPRPRPVPPS